MPGSRRANVNVVVAVVPFGEMMIQHRPNGRQE
jgi:hypothetical protein